MSKNIFQIYTDNPITSNASGDLMYFGQSPYGVTDDAAMLYSNFAAQFGGPFTPAALTRVSDTNVTLTLGGTPATALLQAVSITAGWSGQLSPTRGGTGVSNPTAHGIMIAEGSSAMTPIVLSSGQILIGSSGIDPVAAAINSGTGIIVANGAGSISVGLSGTAPGTLTWNDVAGTTQAAVINNGYIISNASLTTVTLPATAAVGSVFAVQGKGAAGWVLQANTGQVIHLGSSATSSAGSLASTNLWDSVSIVCVTANTTFAVTAVVGNLTVA